MEMDIDSGLGERAVEDAVEDADGSDGEVGWS